MYEYRYELQSKYQGTYQFIKKIWEESDIPRISSNSERRALITGGN
jgi:hypothetical protein